MKKIHSSPSIGFLILGNFLCYIPMYMFVRMASKGSFTVLQGQSVTSFEILPLFAVGNIIVTSAFLSFFKWFKYLSFRKFHFVPLPQIKWYIAISGLCIIIQIIAANWAYAFKNISIVFVALLMKGGVLIIAPIVDFLSIKRKRKIHWPSWIAAGLSLIAVLISFMEKSDVRITVICAIDIAAYITVYFIRLSVMSRWAKSPSDLERRQFITQEQIVIALGLAFLLIPIFLFGPYSQTSIFQEIYNGFTLIPKMGFIVYPILAGMTGAGVGLFGTMVFLDQRENTFCIAAVKSSSILASTLSSYLLYLFFNDIPLSPNKMIGVTFILGAIFFLVLRSRVKQNPGELYDKQKQAA